MITAEGIQLAGTAGEETGFAKAIPSAEAEPASETTTAAASPETESGKVEDSTTAGKGGSRRIISLIIGLAAVAGGLAIYKKIEAV
ncbi:MAG: hypothetical protein CEE38_09145 [Planctomycetes bacterium B3_Pla]|nr:MAG: hypothetical protein CEE38_09145 [Planctomycetes bacterium B3_Pla]